MLDHIKIDDVLFLDIETVPQYPVLDDSPEIYRNLWEKKARHLADKTGEINAEELYHRAGIYAEFGKIICISAGFIRTIDNELNLRIKSFYSEDELQLLTGFIDMLNKTSARKEVILCAHNGKEFDFPYIARRILIKGLKLPRQLDLAGKKPWDVPHLDTLELWKFGDYKSYTSLELLTSVFNIESPKNDIDGSMVAEVYWKDHDLRRIVDYCENDVLAVARLFMKFKGIELFKPGNIESVTE
ncbi:MAG: 3'-5' exonuclease [Bacteroidia bacterium]|nr:3'-5' exonuclease [Bacteroidia bacterium]